MKGSKVLTLGWVGSFYISFKLLYACFRYNSWYICCMEAYGLQCEDFLCVYIACARAVFDEQNKRGAIKTIEERWSDESYKVNVYLGETSVIRVVITVESWHRASKWLEGLRSFNNWLHACTYTHVRIIIYQYRNTPVQLLANTRAC